MILAILLLLTGLTISAVAIYYSVVGLTAIFSAAAIPIIVMGSALEIAKLVCASWLKANWNKTPVLMKTYMTIAVLVLMVITSMGIFGFLSKAHSDQSLVTGNIQAQLAVYDQKIDIAKQNIANDQQQLAQMDAAVNQVLARSTNERGALTANSIRRSQTKERAGLQKDIEANQKVIADVSEQSAPIRSQQRKAEADVGPIKYIAQLIYGDNPSQSLLERAVTWVILMIVVVFDPLAVIMLLASQMTFQWNRKQGPSEPEEPQYPKDDGPLTAEQIDQINQTSIKPVEDPENTTDPVEQWNKIIEEAERAAAEEDTVIDRVARGDSYINTEGQEIVLEEDSKKKIHDQGTGSTDSEKPSLGYVQNSEQSSSSLWSRIQQARLRPKDELSKEYSDHGFKNLVIEKDFDPELFQFVEDIKKRGPRFSDYSPEQIERFANKIYELRKDNSNYTA